MMARGPDRTTGPHFVANSIDHFSSLARRSPSFIRLIVSTPVLFQASGAEQKQAIGSASGLDQEALISPVSGLTISAVAWFCSVLADVLRRPTDCLRR